MDEEHGYRKKMKLSELEQQYRNGLTADADLTAKVVEIMPITKILNDGQQSNDDSELIDSFYGRHTNFVSKFETNLNNFG